MSCLQRAGPGQHAVAAGCWQAAFAAGCLHHTAAGCLHMLLIAFYRLSGARVLRGSKNVLSRSKPRCRRARKERARA